MHKNLLLVPLGASGLRGLVIGHPSMLYGDGSERSYSSNASSGEVGDMSNNAIGGHFYVLGHFCPNV